MTTYKVLRDYVVVFIGSLNDTDPAVAMAASECLLHVMDTRGKEFPKLVELLVPTQAAGQGDQEGEEKQTNDLNRLGNPSSKTTTAAKEGGAGGGKTTKATTKSKHDNNKGNNKDNKETVLIKKRQMDRIVQRPKCLMHAFFAQTERTKNYR